MAQGRAFADAFRARAATAAAAADYDADVAGGCPNSVWTSLPAVDDAHNGGVWGPSFQLCVHAAAASAREEEAPSRAAMEGPCGRAAPCGWIDMGIDISVDDEDDPATLQTRPASASVLRWEFCAAYSEVWRCPVLFFNCTGSDGALLPVVVQSCAAEVPVISQM
ncbi:hypothetical protein HK405_015614, partial [Cladochytrium tenue]